MSRSVVRFVGRTLLFIAVLIPCYLLVLFVAVNGARGGIRGLRLTNVPAAAFTSGGQSRLAVDEIGGYQSIDILWVGSSHAYRTFDPRFFDTRNVTTFNLGTTAQTPLNTYYLLRRYLDQIQPRTVVMELYWAALSWDGVESALDLASNMPIGPELFEMAVSTGDVRAVNAVLRRLLEWRTPHPAPFASLLFEGDEYIGRGFVAKDPTFEGRRTWDDGSLTLRPKQLRYLEKIVHLVAGRGATLVFVVQPLPRATLQAIPNRHRIGRSLRDFAVQTGTPYFDFSESLTLDDSTHFFDDNHLNHNGIREFLPALYDSLRSRDLLPGI